MFKPGIPSRLTQTMQTCSGFWPPFSALVPLLLCHHAVWASLFWSLEVLVRTGLVTLCLCQEWKCTGKYVEWNVLRARQHRGFMHPPWTVQNWATTRDSGM